MQQLEREATHSPTPRAGACRKPGQRLKKTQRRKLQAQFIDLLGTIHNGAAMESLGLSRFTLYAWLRDPEFKLRYDEKLATFKLEPVELTDEELDRAVSYWMMQPPWRIIQRMKMHERMKQRRGEDANIWW